MENEVVRGVKKRKKSFRNWSAKKRKQWKLTYARNSNNWHAGNYFPLRLIGIFCWFCLPFAVVFSVELFGGGNFSELFGANRLYPGIAIDIWSVGVRTGLPFPFSSSGDTVCSNFRSSIQATLYVCWVHFCLKLLLQRVKVGLFLLLLSYR